MDKVLIIGSGGREHSLGWQLAQSDQVGEVVYTPGNAGTANELKGRNVAVDLTSIDGLVDVVRKENPDLTLVGPEAPLAAGLINVLNRNGYRRVIGPTKAAAQLEGSKIFSQQLMTEAGVPQARSIACYSLIDAQKAIAEIATEKGVVLKADGLAGGKGVQVFDTREEALSSVGALLQKYGNRILVAERLEGEEFSIFAFSDGKNVLHLRVAFQDHKRLYDGNKGPNTGGMGAYGPVPIADGSIIDQVVETAIKPIILTMDEKSIPFRGILYAGMMMTKEGSKVLEYNVRFGDPECEAAMKLLQSSLFQIFAHTLTGNMQGADVSIKPGAACTVVMAAKGYPERPQDGFTIHGLERRYDNVKVFHGGTKVDGERIVASGGRILAVTGYSPTGIEEATRRAYDVVQEIAERTGKDLFHYRNDIALQALKK